MEKRVRDYTDYHPDYTAPPCYGPIAYWKKPTGDKRQVAKLLKDLDKRRLQEVRG